MRKETESKLLFKSNHLALLWSAIHPPGLSVGAWYRRHHPGSQTGAVTVIQRASSDLRLNPDFHTLFLCGVFLLGPNPESSDAGAPVLEATPTPTQEDIEWILHSVRSIGLAPKALRSRRAA